MGTKSAHGEVKEVISSKADIDSILERLLDAGYVSFKTQGGALTAGSFLRDGDCRLLWWPRRGEEYDV